ncbi:SDR family NAD(P)-dependent oxidoreductase [Microbacterium sp. RD1]|uniref:SDR family NAD(P)-dependent oxidoreductase n=1 Tax=Microbacterium sp. RD1 TaxID=3457313 RepID=UPI003FA5BBA6
MRLTDKTAIITGAGNGMGLAGARLFAAEGANVLLTDIDESLLSAAVDSIRAEGGSAHYVVADASSEADNDAAVAEAVQRFGGLDIVWANAGIPQTFTSITDTTVEQFDRLMAINARGPWLAARSAKQALIERGGGSIVITASLSGLKARADLAGYQTSKGAAVMLTRSLARELAPFRIRVNSVCPLAANTQMWGQFLGEGADIEAATAAAVANVPLGRLTEASDVAHAALFLASSESSFITGVNLPVDGGSLA